MFYNSHDTGGVVDGCFDDPPQKVAIDLGRQRFLDSRLRNCFRPLALALVREDKERPHRLCCQNIWSGAPGIPWQSAGPISKPIILLVLVLGGVEEKIMLPKKGLRGF